MSPQRHGSTRPIVFLAREPAGEGLRCAEAVKRLDRVRLFGICERGPRGRDADAFDDMVLVDDVHDAGQLIVAARGLAERHGSLHQVVTAQETLLRPTAEVNEALGLRGLDVAAVDRALDKSRLRHVLDRAGVGTARGSPIASADDARRFADEVGFPLVLKPLGGSGGLATLCVRGVEQLAMAIDLMKPSPENVALAEELVVGQELCIDTITIAGAPRLASICWYRPSILEALEDRGVQWSCVMPRDNGGERCREFIAQGLTAVRALAVGDAVTHMEGFLTDRGEPRFTDATLRPAGARIGPMLGLAYDIDPHLAWARAAVDGAFDGPWERTYAVGTVFLRGTGSGRVEQVAGLDEVNSRLGDLLVDHRPPQPGAPRSATYTGDGYMTVRHAETRVVEAALRLIAETVRITYTHPATPDAAPEDRRERWAGRLGYFDQQLYRPAWEHASPPRDGRGAIGMPGA